MLQTVEASVEPSGVVRLLEALRVDHPCRAVLTLLEAPLQSMRSARGSAAALLRFLQDHPLPLEGRRPAEEIDAQILNERSAWD